MEILNEIISLLRVVIIPLGVTFRVIFCLTKMIYDEDAQGTYKKKIKNTKKKKRKKERKKERKRIKEL